MLKIEEYTAPYQEKVVAHILAIQRDEFGIAITRADQPDLDAIDTFYRQGAGNFWLAIDGSEVVGTVALVDIGNDQGALRKMFVRPAYRGKPHRAAGLLLAALFEWSRSKGLCEIYLGTTDRFLAAHRFYEKNGFAAIDKAALPPAFPVMKVDSKFYRYTL